MKTLNQIPPPTERPIGKRRIFRYAFVSKKHANVFVTSWNITYTDYVSGNNVTFSVGNDVYTNRVTLGNGVSYTVEQVYNDETLPVPDDFNPPTSCYEAGRW